MTCLNNWTGRAAVNEVDVKRIIGEVAARHGMLLGDDDPLMVALTANGLVLEVLARELMAESAAIAERLEAARVTLPEETRVALIQAAEQAAASVRAGLNSDIEGATVKARAIVDAVYRAQSRAVMWMWIAVGVIAALIVFLFGFVVGWRWR